MILFLILLLIFFGRFNSSIFGYELLNTDEFVIAAKASRLMSDYSFYEFDGDTSGILNAVFLMWPGLLNFDLTYLSLRLSAVLAVSLLLFFTYKIISLYCGKKLTFFLSLPIILFFAFTKDPDFLHYTNELISILLILISLFIYLKHFDNLNSLRIFLISSVLGLVLFAKMQFFPIACLLILTINLKFIFQDRNFKNFIISSCSFIFPTLIITSYYFVNNEIKDLFYNVLYFPLSDLFARNEITKKELIIGSNSLQSIIQSNKKTILIDHLIQNSFFHLLYLYFLYFSFLYLKNASKLNIQNLILPFLNFRVFILALTIIFTLFIIFITGSVHRHYFINLLPLVPIFIATYFGLNKRSININPNFGFLFFLIFVFIISLSFENKKFYSKNFVHKNFLSNKISFYSPEIYQYFVLDKKKDKILVWGWKPEIYLLSGLYPSNRETTNLKQIDFRQGRNYFRERFVKEFFKNNPEIFIDYAKKEALFYSDEKYGVSSFVELQERISQKYMKIQSMNADCPDFYLKKDQYQKLKNQIIEFKTPHQNESLNDFNIDEDMCRTSVIFSNSSNNFLKLSIEPNKPIKSIKVFSAKKNDQEVNIELLFFKEKKMVKKKQMTLRKQPFWSSLTFENKFLADEIKIDVNNLKNKSFGINEIKIYSK